MNPSSSNRRRCGWLPMSPLSRTWLPGRQSRSTMALPPGSSVITKGTLTDRKAAQGPAVHPGTTGGKVRPMVLPLDQRGPLTGSPTAAATTGILASYVTTARRYAPTAQAVARWPGPWRDGPGRGEMDGVEAPQRSARSQRARSQNPAVLRYLVHPGVRRVDGKPVPGAPLAVAYRECQPDGRPGGPEDEESSCRPTSTCAPLVPSGWRRCTRTGRSARRLLI